MDRHASHLPLLLALGIGAVMGLGVGGLSCSSSEDGAANPPAPSADSGLDAQHEAATTPEAGMDVIQTPDEFSDFPKAPIVGSGLPSNIADLVAAQTGSNSGGPCLAEPPLEALVPSNWSPLIFEWKATGDQNLFELTLSVDNQLNDLVVYTTDTSYTIDAQTWELLMLHSSGRDLEVTLRGASFDGTDVTSGPATGASG
ncbi:MAG: hypothetical protein ACOC1F_11545, partial [Myxococcota bacterium]